MYNVQIENDILTFESSTRLCYVDRVVDDCKNYLKNLGFTDFTDIILVIRELIINAIEHGNENSIEKKVTGKIEYRGRGRFHIIVEDEGEGFTYNKLNLNLPKSGNKGRRCGYPLIYALSDMVRFNKKGNRITAYITIPQKIEFNIRFEDNLVIVTPSGDLTATSAETFRTILMKLYDDGHTGFCFDLTKVCDIDSISLGVFFSFGKMIMDKNIQDENNNNKPMLINVEKRLSTFFILTGLDQLYTIHLHSGETKIGIQ